MGLWGPGFAKWELTPIGVQRNFSVDDCRATKQSFAGVGPSGEGVLKLGYGSVRRVRILLAVVLVAVVASGAHAQAARQEALASSLETFCVKWMGFLEQRERDNKQKIAWRALGEEVEGEFVGYTKDYTCALSELRPDTKVPVGTIKYLEYKYRHKGTSTSLALENRPKIIEAVEVTEIFRYSKNKWVY